MATISFGRFAPASTLTNKERESGPGFLRRLRVWMLHRRTCAELQDADAHTLQDVGLTPVASTDLVRTFGVEPTSLWGIGEVPMPLSEKNGPSHRR